jgi:hypothetical protein
MCKCDTNPVRAVQKKAIMIFLTLFATNHNLDINSFSIHLSISLNAMTDKRQRMGIHWAYADPHLAAYMFAAAAAAASAPYLQPDYWAALTHSSSTPPLLPPSNHSPLMLPLARPYSNASSALFPSDLLLPAQSPPITTTGASKANASPDLLTKVEPSHSLTTTNTINCQSSALPSILPALTTDALTSSADHSSNDNLACSPNPTASSPSLSATLSSFLPHLRLPPISMPTASVISPDVSPAYSTAFTSALVSGGLSTAHTLIDGSALDSSSASHTLNDSSHKVKKGMSGESRFLSCNLNEGSSYSSSDECIDLRLPTSTSPTTQSLASELSQKRLLLQNTSQLIRSAQLLQSSAALRKPLFQPYLSPLDN